MNNIFDFFFGSTTRIGWTVSVSILLLIGLNPEIVINLFNNILSVFVNSLIPLFILVLLAVLAWKKVTK